MMCNQSLRMINNRKVLCSKKFASQESLWIASYKPYQFRSSIWLLRHTQLHCTPSSCSRYDCAFYNALQTSIHPPFNNSGKISVNGKYCRYFLSKYIMHVQLTEFYHMMLRKSIWQRKTHLMWRRPIDSISLCNI